MKPSLPLVLSALAGLLALTGCAQKLTFPDALATPPEESPARACFDTDADGRADFFHFADDTGRVTRIGYDLDGDARADRIVDLDAVPVDQARHLVLILDGFPHELLAEFYQAGHLRIMHPPSLVIAPYPGLTDLCMEDILGYIPTPGFEGKYYNKRENKLVGGVQAYLHGNNKAYNQLLDYRVNLLLDGAGYVWPFFVFERELRSAKKNFDERTGREFIAYFASSAGVGTRGGRAGQWEALLMVERLVNQVLWESNGLCKVTLLSDHGHSHQPGKEAPIQPHLEARGWRVRDRLAGPDDVVYIRFGLETYASFYARDPARLAEDLSACQGVQITSYIADGTVHVLGPEGSRALVGRTEGGNYTYRPLKGDPLELAGVLAKLTPRPDGGYDPDEMLAASARHVYPIPLQRLWRAHTTLAQNPPDVIVSLADDYYSGSKAFASIVDVVSTHGGLNFANSSAFAMSSAGPIQSPIRSRQVNAQLAELMGLPDWPAAKANK